MGARRAGRALGFRFGSGLALAWLAAAVAIGCGDDPKHKKPAGPIAACASDADCEGGRCDPFAGCAECFFDRDCGADARCVERTCHAIISCATDDECDGGSCDTEAGRCLECVGAADCQESQRCTEGVCVDYQPCSADKDCEDGRRCDVKQGECVACLTDRDCAGDTACNDGLCVPHCASNDDCPAVYHCEDELCSFDLCDPGQASCSAAGNATLLCTDAGDGFDLSPCGTGKGCTLNDGEAQCQKWVCLPGEWQCDESFEHAELCSADGSEVVRSLDCAEAGEVCEAGECVAVVCEPDERRCQDAGIVTCSPSGGREVLEPCSEGESCDPETIECVALVCEPGSLGCLAETIATCLDDGSGFEASGDDCAESDNACWDGSCAPVVCGGDLQCIDGNSFACAANRTKLELHQECTVANGNFCNTEIGQCQEFVCEPGLPTCNGDLATSCADDGSHPLDFGIDCTATDKVCWAAECLPPLCVEGSYQCSDTTLLHCVHKGTALEPDQECGEGTVCDAEAGTCRLQKCVPDQPACNGAIATLCDSTGLGYIGDAADCGADSNVCVSGACVPVICEPSAVYCQDNEARECGPNGGSFELLDACLPSEYCNATLGACVPDACVPDAPVCTANVLGKCNAEGSGPLSGGTDCTQSDQICDRGACRALVCAPNARFCSAGDVTLCNTSGTGFAPYDNCRQVEFCHDTEAGSAVCGADLCPQGGNACSGEHLATCKADGSGVSSVGLDCAATSKVCTLSGSCSTEALDEVGGGGAAVPLASNAIHFGLFRVLTTRKVIELEAATAPPTDAVLWVVYHSDTELGTYAKVTQISAPTAVSGGYDSSGAIDVSFSAGGYYLVAAAVSGAHDITVAENAAPASTSFGSWLGGFSYVAGEPPTVPTTIEVGPGLVGDSVALRVHSTLP